MLLRILFTMVVLCLTVLQHATSRKLCRDQSRMCDRIGRHRPSSKCYKKYIQKQCCATCRALRDDSSPGCEYGDLEAWCSSLGARYATSSCYENEKTCCKTCQTVKSSIPGCEYGDKELWCRNIGKLYSSDQCKGHGNDTCCHTCYTISLTTSTDATSENTERSTSVIKPSASPSSAATSSVITSPAITLPPHLQPAQEYLSDNDTNSIRQSNISTESPSPPSHQHALDILDPTNYSENQSVSLNDTEIYFSDKSSESDSHANKTSSNGTAFDGSTDNLSHPMSTSSVSVYTSSTTIPVSSSSHSLSLYNVSTSWIRTSTSSNHLSDNTTTATQPPKANDDTVVYSESEGVQHVLLNDSVIEVKLKGHTYPEKGTTDDEDLLIDGGSADYDEYEHHRKQNKHKHEHNFYKGSDDYDYSYEISDADYALFKHPVSSGTCVMSSLMSFIAAIVYVIL